jgi:MFS family permease
MVSLDDLVVTMALPVIRLELITQGMSWHWIFWVNVPIGILAIALSALTTSRRPEASRARPPSEASVPENA